MLDKPLRTITMLEAAYKHLQPLAKKLDYLVAIEEPSERATVPVLSVYRHGHGVILSLAQQGNGLEIIKHRSSHLTDLFRGRHVTLGWVESFMRANTELVLASDFSPPRIPYGERLVLTNYPIVSISPENLGPLLDAYRFLLPCATRFGYQVEAGQFKVVTQKAVAAFSWDITETVESFPQFRFKDQWQIEAQVL
ncbi:MAG: hypothetical protein K9K38_12095 [Rhodoferax sp.]|nr:hypothetical protein [Rhodoferax sp.]